MIDAQWAEARRVLAVRLDNLGDVLLATPAIHTIRESLPDAGITLLASEAGAQVGRLNRDVSDVIVHEAPWVDPWQQLPHDPERVNALVATLAERRFDAAVIFTSFRQSSLPAALVCYLAGIPLRLAASIDGPGSLLTTRHKHPERMMHEVERGLDLVSAVGMGTRDRQLVLEVPNDARERVRKRLASPRRTSPLIVIHPGCSMPARTYPAGQFAEVAEMLAEGLDATVAVTGGEAERELVMRVVEGVRPETRHRIVPLAGTLTFAELCALIEAADLTVTNNTGPMHVSAAVGTPVVSLFALTNPPEQWRPWQVPHRLLYHDVPCRLCYSKRCPVGHECLRLVTPETVVEAAASLLGVGSESASEAMAG